MSTIDYGTLGHVEYQAQKGEWSVVRRSQSQNEISCLGDPILIVQPLPKGDASRSVKGGRQKVALRFTGSHPEFVPAANHIIEMFQESNDVQYLSQWAISKTSPLIAIGYATQAHISLGGGHAPRRVIVHVAGRSGNKIAIAALQKQRLVANDILIRRSSVKPQLQTIFECEGPIEQIQPVQKAETKRNKPYIVVRTQNFFYVIQITSETSSVAGDPIFGAVCIAVMEARAIGYSGFLHLAVNPWRGEQIAFVDSNGRWGVWDFPLRNSKRNKYAAPVPIRIAVGELFPGDKDTTISWASVAWGSVEQTLLVATRKELFRIDIQTGVVVDIYPEIIDSSSRVVELVSLTRSQTRTGKLLLLTNYNLITLDLIPELKSKLVWKHFRHPEDRSLCCSIWSMDGAECILLYSRYNPNITVIWGLENAESLDLSMLVAKWSKSPIMGIALLEGSTEEIVGDTIETRGKFFTLVTIGSDYDIWTQDCIFNRSINPKIFRKIQQRNKKPVLSNQIIDSSDESDIFTQERGDDGNDLGSTFERLSLGNSSLDMPIVSILNFGKVYQRVFDDEQSMYKTGGQVDGHAFLREYLLRLKLALHEITEVGSRNPEFFNFRQPKADLEGLFDDLSVLSAEVDDVALTLRLPSVSVINLETARDVGNISSRLLIFLGRSKAVRSKNDILVSEKLYDSLNRIWLEALPVDFPPRFRLRRERLARMLSIDVGLSLLGAFPRLVNLKAVDPSAICTSDSDTSQSILDHSTNDGHIGPREDRSIEIGLPEYPRLQIRGEACSRKSGLASRMFLENFTPVTHNFAKNKDFDGLLSDWDTGQAPEHYCWRALSSIQQEQDALLNPLGHQSRSKSRSRKGFKARGAPSTHKVSYTPRNTSLENLSLTQPATLSVMASSQETSSQRHPASQIYKGKHGDSRRTKKRRTEGF